MSGKIGDYIHAHKANYLRYGLNQKENGATWSANDFARYKQQIVNNFKPSSNATLTVKQKEKYIKNIKAIMSTDDHSNQQVKNIQKYIENELSSRFTGTMGSINFETANVTKLEREKINTIHTKSNQKNITTARIQKTIDMINNRIDEVKSPTSREELFSIMQGIDKELKKLAVDEEGNIKMMIGIDKANNIITQLNTIIKNNFSKPAIGLQKGELFEYIAALAPLVGKKIAQDNFNRIAVKAAQQKIGDARTHTTINLGEYIDSNIASALANASIKGYKVNPDGNNTIVSILASQDKIDVNLEWGGKEVPISLKNVNLQNGYDVHIVSGTSLLYLLQDEGSDFVNHYLNIASTHEDGIFTGGLVAAAHDAAKMVIVIKALTGSTYGRKSATTFIINDNSTGEVKIFDMTDLIKQLDYNQELFSVTANSSSNDLGSVYFDNQMLYSNQLLSTTLAINRIANLLLDVHRQKISVTLKPSLFIDSKI